MSHFKLYHTAVPQLEPTRPSASGSDITGCGLVQVAAVSGKMTAQYYSTSRSNNYGADSAARVARNAGDSAPGARGTVCLSRQFVSL